ncbi:hypothetical protein ZWY2020_054643 [Hordeum vulgare]|nr:hypothetical protein ZWY2020_054643 [Hordeum vulgare]
MPSLRSPSPRSLQSPRSSSTDSLSPLRSRRRPVRGWASTSCVAQHHQRLLLPPAADCRPTMGNFAFNDASSSVKEAQRASAISCSLPDLISASPVNCCQVPKGSRRKQWDSESIQGRSGSFFPPASRVRLHLFSIDMSEPRLPPTKKDEFTTVKAEQHQ